MKKKVLVLYKHQNEDRSSDYVNDIERSLKDNVADIKSAQLPQTLLGDPTMDLAMDLNNVAINLAIAKVQHMTIDRIIDGWNPDLIITDLVSHPRGEELHLFEYLNYLTSKQVPVVVCSLYIPTSEGEGTERMKQNKEKAMECGAKAAYCLIDTLTPEDLLKYAK